MPAEMPYSFSSARRWLPLGPVRRIKSSRSATSRSVVIGSTAGWVRGGEAI